MSSPVPPGWSGFKLSDWTTLYPYGAGDIFWNEVTDKISHSRLRLSGNQGSAAEMVFATTFDSLQAASTGPTVIGAGATTMALSILGGYDSAGSTMRTPWAHPQYPNLYATDIEVTPASLDNTHTSVTGKPAFYRYAYCKVSFQAHPYPFTGDFAWIETRAFANNDRITMPVGSYQFSPAAPTGQTDAQFGQVLTQGASYIQFILHRLPASSVLDMGGSSPVPGIADYCGYVNSDDTALTPGVNQWLLDSVDLGQPYGDCLGEILYDVKLNLIFLPNTNGNTWNKSLDSSGNWQAITFRNGSTPPFPSVSLSTQILGMIP